MTRETEEKLAGSLTAETADLLPFLPYLLQDFWELGSTPSVMLGLIQAFVPLSENTSILDLACGKGAVSVKLAEKLHVKTKGIDLLPEFIAYAKQKAADYGVGNLCDFIVGDINEAVETERNHDCVILGAVGNVLGSPAETLRKLKDTIKPGGYMLIDECYLSGKIRQEDMRYNNYEYLTEQQWNALFQEAGVAVMKTVFDAEDTENLDSVAGMAAITARANELIAKHPDQKELFEGYIRSQQNEYDDIDDSLVAVTWILKKGY